MHVNRIVIKRGGGAADICTEKWKNTLNAGALRGSFSEHVGVWVMRN